MVKSAYIKTFGCQMNEYDSQRMRALLAQQGFQETVCLHEAHLLLVNTCTVREKPEQKALSMLGRFQQVKKEDPSVILAVTGCVAQQKGTALLRRFPDLDIVLGPDYVDRLPEIVEMAERGDGPICKTGFENGSTMRRCIPASTPLRAFVTIMQGCNNFCSYCIVPYVRGRERSRPSEDIVAEVEALVARGTREVILLGQNVNSYGYDGGVELTFPRLLTKIGRISGLQRVRFTTSHPKDLSDELIEAVATTEAACEHIHLPFQAGSNEVLRRMKRGYTKEEYLHKTEKLKASIPGVSITSDVIVGFSGETEQDFEQTLNLMKEVQFDALFSFKYSPRQGTRAATLVDDVPLAVKQRRLSDLQQLQRRTTLEKNRALEGSVKEILVEGPSRNCPRDVTGRTRCNRIVHVSGGPEVTGRLVHVTVTKGMGNSLRGEMYG
jgi:tRNA-2-methylthio-N6-dimethylallyladenosine synthase